MFLILQPFAFSSIGGGFVTRNGKVQVPKSAAAYQIEMEKIEQSGRVTQLHLQQMQNHQSEGVVIAGQQERVWGFPIALQGQISNICLFHESLSSADVITLYSRGKYTPLIVPLFITIK